MTFFKIIMAGAIATLIQRTMGLNPISFEGFAVFMFIFVVVSFLYQFVFPKKENIEKTKEEIEKKIEANKRVNVYYFSLFKKFVLIILTIFILNIIVNFISYKSGLFDDTFKYRFDTSKAIALNLKDKKPIKFFELHNEFYFLYKYKEKYFLVKQKENMRKDKVLTLYDSFGSLDYIFDFIKDKENFYDIVDNLSPTVYEEVPLIQMFYKPLWFSNSIKYIYWMSHQNNKIKEKHKKYLDQKKKEKLKEKQKKYNSLLNKDLKSISNEELKQTIEKLYASNAFTRNTRYVISLIDECEKRGLKDKNILRYQMNLMSYLYLVRTKSKLNDILKKYEMGVVYTFTFLDRQPLDIPKQKFSHIRLADLKRDTKLLLWQDKIQDIKNVDESVVIDFKNDKNIKFDFDKTDAKNIKLKLTSMISTVYAIEREFNKRTKEKK